MLSNIKNQKLLDAINKNDLVTAEKIASKLYKKARGNDFEQELALSNILKFCRGQKLDDISNELNEYKNEIAYLDRRHAVENSESYKTESDPLKRFMMKELA